MCFCRLHEQLQIPPADSAGSRTTIFIQLQREELFEQPEALASRTGKQLSPGWFKVSAESQKYGTPLKRKKKKKMHHLSI